MFFLLSILLLLYFTVQACKRSVDLLLILTTIFLFLTLGFRTLLILQYFDIKFDSRDTNNSDSCEHLVINAFPYFFFAVAIIFNVFRWNLLLTILYKEIEV